MRDEGPADWGEKTADKINKGKGDSLLQGISTGMREHDEWENMDRKEKNKTREWKAWEI